MNTNMNHNIMRDYEQRLSDLEQQNKSLIRQVNEFPFTTTEFLTSRLTERENRGSDISSIENRTMGGSISHRLSGHTRSNGDSKLESELQKSGVFKGKVLKDMEDEKSKGEVAIQDLRPDLELMKRLTTIQDEGNTSRRRSMTPQKPQDHLELIYELKSQIGQLTVEAKAYKDHLEIEMNKNKEISLLGIKRKMLSIIKIWMQLM